MRLLKNWWFVTIACALLMALLLAVGLPLFVGFLRPWWVRLLCVLLVGGVWGTLAFLRRRKAQQAARALGEELAPSAEDEEDRALGQRMRDALAQMKGLRASGGITSTRGPGMSSSARRVRARRRRCSIPACAFPSTTARSRAWAARATSISGSPMKR
jgi:cbb3-type cytochrome oxidase subunit 3